MSRAIKKPGLTQKKQAIVASGRGTERVKAIQAQFQARQASLGAERLGFIDETGSTEPRHGHIEECWSKVKGFLKGAKARTWDALGLALA